MREILPVDIENRWCALNASRFPGSRMIRDDAPSARSDALAVELEVLEHRAAVGPEGSTLSSEEFSSPRAGDLAIDTWTFERFCNNKSGVAHGGPAHR